MNEKIVEIRIESPISSLSKLNFSAITNVVTATGIDASKVKTFISWFLNINNEIKIATAGKRIILKNEIKNDHCKFFFDWLCKNAPRAKRAIGDAVDPSIAIVFSILSKSRYSNFRKLKRIPSTIEIISGFFARLMNSLW